MKERKQLTSKEEAFLPKIHIEFSVTHLDNGNYVVYMRTDVGRYHIPSLQLSKFEFKLYRRGMKFLGYRKSTSGKCIHFYYSPKKIAA